jgi:peptidoglycan/LPS O-acetylase OafA/YrhL
MTRTPKAPSGRVWRNPRLDGRILELDGVRGLAILLVLIEHYIRDASQIHLARWEAVVLVPFRLAWSGVDLFFVLSGFLIGGILIDARTADNYYQTFYIRRSYRILPLYYLWFGLFLVGLHLSAVVQAGAIIKAGVLHLVFNRELPLWSYPLFMQNIAMSLHGTTGPMWLGVTWSLAVEEQFYSLLPLAIRNLTTKGVLRLVCAAIVIAPVLRVILLSSGSGPLAPYSLLPCRADALGYGVLIAIVVRNKRAWIWLASRRPQIYLVFALLGVGACLMTKLPFASRFFMGIGFSMLAAFYAALLLLVIVNPGRGERLVFRWKPLMKLGTVAYAVYIFHAGVSFLVHCLILGGEPSFDGWAAILVTILSLIVVLFLATISWQLMEKPLIKHAHSKFHYSLRPDPSCRLYQLDLMDTIEPETLSFRDPVGQ